MWSHDGRILSCLFDCWIYLNGGRPSSVFLVTTLALLVVDVVGNFVVVVDVVVRENVDPIFLCGIFDGVLPSSLTSDNVEPCLEVGLDVGRDVPGVKLDRTGIDVFVVIVVVNVLEGVRRPYDAESE